MPLRIDDAYLMAMYPYLIVGTVLAATFCGWATWTLRRSRLQLWWLLAGVSMMMAMAAFENIWFLTARLTQAGLLHPPFKFTLVEANQNIIILLFIKMGLTVSVWMQLYVAVAVNWGKYPTGRWVRRALILGSIAFFLTYPLMVFLLGR